jgi:hypothetical protein
MKLVFSARHAALRNKSQDWLTQNKKTSYHLSPQNLEHQDHDIMALIMSIPDEGYYGTDYERT